ncbi:MAG: uracil-DNA glycosylase [Sphingobacteriia bacterium]|nr:MAG: uracil-DNA glycosylase [Sphingobacteriia bacterium]
MRVNIAPDWQSFLAPCFEAPYFEGLRSHLKAEKASGQTIYPPGPQIFEAFRLTALDQVKLIILGQDPYHGPGQAHGLSFSVPVGIKPPPSLANIFKELKSDLGLPLPSSGNLVPWAEQGVLMLNASLTVRANEPGSHAKIGWIHFTDELIARLSGQKQHLVFMLWGKFAQEKKSLIDPHKHFVLTAAHPSPFSADKGFFGCRHFSQANQWLVQHGMDPINWFLP